jgi:methionine synthase II (cobalamin-independent)
MSSTVHLQPPFRAEHIGSLLRPKTLFEKRQQLESKQCTSSDLKPFEDDAVKHVVELQRNVGIKTITDGELRRLAWISTPSLPFFDCS